MLRDKPLAAGSERQPLTAPLEDRHLHHGRLRALGAHNTSQSAKDDRREGGSGLSCHRCENIKLDAGRRQALVALHSEAAHDRGVFNT